MLWQPEAGNRGKLYHPGLKKQGRNGAKEEGPPLGAKVREGTADNRKAAFKLVGILKTQHNAFFCPLISCWCLPLTEPNWKPEHQNPESWPKVVNFQAAEKGRQEIRVCKEGDWPAPRIKKKKKCDVKKMNKY